MIVRQLIILLAVATLENLSLKNVISPKWMPLIKMDLSKMVAEKVDTDLLFKFGIISDIQYVDVPDALNFQQTKLRKYRQSLEIFQKAVKYWMSSVDNVDIKFALILGDMIDGKSIESKSQFQCMTRLKKISELLPCESYYCFGNHCHYSFDRVSIVKNFLADKPWLLKPSSKSPDLPCRPSKIYYHWSPHPGWRFVCVDSYDVSLIGSSSIANKQLAEELLATNNPNDLTMSGTWFNNLPYEKRRWVPYNGGVSDTQLNWLKQTLQHAKSNSERVVIFSHQPIYAEKKPQSVIWNSESILDIIWQAGNVALWIAGHDHDGQYSIDPQGVHHMVPSAPIECDDGELAFGHFEVFPSHLVLRWSGKQPTDPVLPWPANQTLLLQSMHL